MTEAAAWDAVVARDRASDGMFVFGVQTTGIYCKPSCPARRPLRRNVRFFGSGADAEREGFRACLRCRPTAATLAERARAHLDARLDENVTLEALALAVGASPFHVQRTFVRDFGVSPREYVESRRLARIAGARGTALDAAFGAGFGSSRAAYEAAAKRGVTPAELSRGGFAVRYATAECSVGRLLVAATARRTCWASIGDSDAELIAELRSAYPNADLIADDSVLEARALAGRPLEPEGTDFQKRVWAALAAIPEGSTRTYGDLAAQLGTSPRAVARACASNRVALLIPCHRVVGATGALSGYRWGIERKATLLARERDLSTSRRAGRR